MKTFATAVLVIAGTLAIRCLGDFEMLLDGQPVPPEVPPLGWPVVAAAVELAMSVVVAGHGLPPGLDQLARRRRCLGGVQVLRHRGERHVEPGSRV